MTIRVINTLVMSVFSVRNAAPEPSICGAVGCTAREIGNRLFIDGTHLGNSYIKLGVGSKAELIRLAPHLGL